MAPYFHKDFPQQNDSKQDFESPEFCKWKMLEYMSKIGLHETIAHDFGRNNCVPCLNTPVLCYSNCKHSLQEA